MRVNNYICLVLIILAISASGHYDGAAASGHSAGACGHYVGTAAGQSHASIGGTDTNLCALWYYQCYYFKIPF
jgi:hypothetical protein